MKSVSVVWLFLFIGILLACRYIARMLVALFVLWVEGDLRRENKLDYSFKEKRGLKSENRPFFIQGITRRRKLSLGKRGNVLDGSVLDKWKGHVKKMFGGRK